MLPQEIIRKKRDNNPLSKDEIELFISGITNNAVSDSQIASFCMAIFLNKLSLDERTYITQAMAKSGTVLDWSSSNLDGPVIDKHSSGGVGDKVSLILAPIMAACGAYVPMIAGRGLGHTGGTIDKLEAIPGYKTQIFLSDFQNIVSKVGCAIIAQTADIAPADKRMYAVRDISGTVETLDLITPSILSKKMAAGLSGLVMDIKWGNGAFMNSYDSAIELANSIGVVANHGKLPTAAILTDMNQVLGHSAGNAVEVIESIEFLTGKRRDKRLMDITVALCSQMLILSRLHINISNAEQHIIEVLENSKASEKFSSMVQSLGGPSDILENYDAHLPKAAIIKPIFAESDGYISEMNTREIGLIIIELGGGRIHTSDKIDHSVGISNILSIGSKIRKKEPLLTLHAKNNADWKQAQEKILSLIKISDVQPKEVPIVTKIIPHDEFK